MIIYICSRKIPELVTDLLFNIGDILPEISKTNVHWDMGVNSHLHGHLCLYVQPPGGTRWYHSTETPAPYECKCSDFDLYVRYLISANSFTYIPVLLYDLQPKTGNINFVDSFCNLIF